jgi:hypothetical protein
MIFVLPLQIDFLKTIRNLETKYLNQGGTKTTENLHLFGHEVENSNYGKIKII